jgi:transposase InsO family protein
MSTPFRRLAFVINAFARRIVGWRASTSLRSDLALAQTIIALYKTEVIYRRGPWRNVEAVEFATLEWVDWFNRCRLLEPICNVPPAELETSYYESTGQVPMAG